MDLFWTLFPFAFLASFSPGFNNILLMSLGINHGFRGTLAYPLGAGAACLVFISLLALLGTQIEKHVSLFLPILKYAGCSYILWMAWQVMRSKPATAGGAQASAGAMTGFLMQFANPHWYLYVLTLVGMIIPGVQSLWGIFFYACLCSLVAIAGMLTWGICGSLLQRFLLRWYRIINAVMGLILVWCAWQML